MKQYYCSLVKKYGSKIRFSQGVDPYITLKTEQKDEKLIINEIKNLIGDNKVFADFDSYEIRNMLCASEIIINSALKRKNSIGAHFRTDSCQNFEDINMEMEIQNDKIFVK